ncbi:MAG: ankyrin repeat domain-containing protein, partial [Chloroflexota bacterium]
MMNEKYDITMIYLNGLLRDSGGYADINDGEANLRAYLSVLKTFKELGQKPSVGLAAGNNQTSAGINFIRSCHHANGGFSPNPGSDPAAYDTAVGLICLSNLGEKLENNSGLLAGYLPASLKFISQNAVTQFDHFMHVAVYEECGLPGPIPGTTISFFQQQLHNSIKSKRILDTAIASASLLRAGMQVEDSREVIDLLISGQNTGDGGFGEDGVSSLFITYCVLRTLVLLKVLPNIRRLETYLDSLRTRFGFTDMIGGKTSAGATYMNISLRNWIKQLQAVPVSAAMTGDVEYLKKWLANGGNPNQYDDQGWTVLLAAASRGRSDVVDMLLN